VVFYFQYDVFSLGCEAMIDNNKETVIRFDLDEYIENIINGLSDEECQEIIDSVNNGYLSGIVAPRHIKNYLRNCMREMMTKDVKKNMYEYNPCMGCEYYNKPYWSIVNPCTSCPRVHNTGGYVTTNIKVENHDETTLEYFAKIAEDKMNVEKAMDFLRNLGIQGKTE
jgi:hypothetical protein